MNVKKYSHFVLEGISKKYEPDFRNEDESKWYLAFDISNRKVSLHVTYTEKILGTVVYFRNINDAMEAIEAFTTDEWAEIFGVEEADEEVLVAKYFDRAPEVESETSTIPS